MELNGWSSPQMLQRYGGSARGARARRHYDLHHEGLTRRMARPVPAWRLNPLRCRAADRFPARCGAH